MRDIAPKREWPRPAPTRECNPHTNHRHLGRSGPAASCRTESPCIALALGASWRCSQHNPVQMRQEAEMTEIVKAQGLAYDPVTRDWTELVIVEFRNRTEAIRWMNFQRDWMKQLRILENDQ